MRHDKANELRAEAHKYIGMELPVHVLDSDDKLVRTVDCKFSEIGSTAIGVIGEPQDVRLYAKMEEVSNAKNYYTIPLGEVINEFKKIETTST